jgi:molybdate transport system permease protein
MFAGSLQGLTQTLPLAIYAELDQDFEVALAVGALLIILSAIVLLSIKLLPSWTRFGLTSPLPSARSGLS